MSFRTYWDEAFGLRAGTEAKNAAYALTDLDDTGYTLMQIYQWVVDPKYNPGLTPIWTERLQNSICKIAGFPDDMMNLLLVTKAGPNGERYSASGAPCGVGDGKTFRKTTKLPPDSKILDEASFPATVEGVTDAVNWVRKTVGR